MGRRRPGDMAQRCSPRRCACIWPQITAEPHLLYRLSAERRQAVGWRRVCCPPLRCRGRPTPVAQEHGRPLRCCGGCPATGSRATRRGSSLPQLGLSSGRSAMTNVLGIEAAARAVSLASTAPPWVPLRQRRKCHLPHGLTAPPDRRTALRRYPHATAARAANTADARVTEALAATPAGATAQLCRAAADGAARRPRRRRRRRRPCRGPSARPALGDRRLPAAVRAPHTHTRASAHCRATARMRHRPRRPSSAHAPAQPTTIALAGPHPHLTPCSPSRLGHLARSRADASRPTRLLDRWRLELDATQGRLGVGSGSTCGPAGVRLGGRSRAELGPIWEPAWDPSWGPICDAHTSLQRSWQRGFALPPGWELR